MANNYSQFSEVIEHLTPEEREWVNQLLRAEPEEVQALLGDEDAPPDPDCWPGFEWSTARDQLWLYAEESYCEDNLTLFVQSFIRKFRPDFVFSMTTAQTCDKLRVGEFGGGWIAISATEITGGDTWSEAKRAVEALETE